MIKALPILKMIAKVMLWIAILVVSLFVAIALLVQVPVIQNKIIQVVTSSISRKTNTRIEIKHVGISFPKAVVIEGLYIEDLQKDTLLFAGKAKINIALYDLLANRITIHSLDLEGATVKLNNAKNDPMFNYNFLLTAFKDTLDPVKIDSITPSKWKFNLDQVALQNIRFSYQDEYGGMNVLLVIKKAAIGVDLIDPGKSNYQLGEVEAAGLTANILASISDNTKLPSKSVSPKVGAKRLHLTNSLVSYTDSVGNMSVIAVLNNCQLSDASIDLQKQLLVADEFSLSESTIQYHTFNPIIELAESRMDPKATSGNNWKVTVKHIDLKENSLVYQSGNQSPVKDFFDPEQVKLNKLSLKATDFYYAPDLTKVVVKEFSAIDSNGFVINSFEADFSMDQRAITVKGVKASTANSAIEANLFLEYASMAALMDSMLFSNINLELKKLRFKNADLLYFKPDLIKQSFFKHRQNVTTISGVVVGQLNNLKGTNLVIGTGLNTLIKTDFNIKGLPDIESAFYRFPNLKIISGQQDLAMLVDTLIHQSIAIPENFSLEVAFNGKIRDFETSIHLNSTFGAADIDALVDPQENFSGKISMSSFDLGRLLKDSLLYGPVTFNAATNGHGLSAETINAKIKVDASQLWLNRYSYHNFKLEGTIHGREFGGKISLKDENAVFDLEGIVNLNPHQERLKFQLNVQGADLQKLRLSQKDLRIAFVASADIKPGFESDPKGTAVLIGNAGISKMIIAHEAKKIVIDTFLTVTVNKPRLRESNVRNGLVAIQYSGTESPVALPEILGQFLNNYFPFTPSNSMQKAVLATKFSFGIQLHNHPILKEVFFPQLEEFETGFVDGSFDGEKSELKLNASIKKLVYGTTEIKDLAVNVNSDRRVLNFKIASGAIANSQINLDNISLDGKVEANKIEANISSTSGKQFKKLQIKSLIIKDKGNYKLSINPNEFYLMNNRWEIAADNYLSFGKQGILVHHLFVKHAESQINVASVHDQFNDDLEIVFKNFRLEDVSRIVEKDSSLVKGNVDGNILLKKVVNGYGLIADAKISNLMVHEVPVGNLTIKASNPTSNKFDIEVKLSGTDNNLTANGYFVPNGGNNSIRIQTDIQSLSMKAVQAFSMGQISEAEGILTGNILAEGNVGSPDLTGELVFNKVFINPAFLNNRLELKHETIQLKKEGIYFNSFTLLDKTQHIATIDGMVRMNHFSDLFFDFRINTRDFLLFNTTSKVQKNFFGRMVVDSNIEVEGPLSLAVVKAKVKMKKGSNFTFAVPDDKLSTDRGEDVVEFDNALKLHPILNRGEKTGAKSSGMTGFDLSSVIEIDQEATLRLLMDPASTDSLVVKGNAALSFTMDRSGKMTLTGAYNLNDGSYLVSLESVIKKRFAIKAGSTIIWNGDPLEATISIDAVYSVRASPYDLVADQISGLSEVDQGGYKQRYPFLVLLKLRGEILHPEISFEIQLPPEEKGILGGAVNQKLGMLNEDPGALNKQVFALLVLGRFVQENPFQSESGGTSALVRTTVGKFLSAQLNQLSSKWLPGVELNFDIQSYDDYQSGEARGRTEVEFGIKKQLFNERMSVQVGGAVDVEGDRASQNSVNDLTSDVMLEYKLTKDGRFRLKGFRRSQYEGAIEGQLIETGIGVVYVRDFNRWDRLFRSNRSKNDSTKTKRSDATVNSK